MLPHHSSDLASAFTCSSDDAGTVGKLGTTVQSLPRWGVHFVAPVHHVDLDLELTMGHELRVYRLKLSFSKCPQSNRCCPKTNQYNKEIAQTA
jgi:hypothetical protein